MNNHSPTFHIFKHRINLKRSLFEIELLLSLRPKTLAKTIAGTATPATRWHE
jgi:hypothetical protein